MIKTIKVTKDFKAPPVSNKMTSEKNNTVLLHKSSVASSFGLEYVNNAAK